MRVSVLLVLSICCAVPFSSQAQKLTADTAAFGSLNRQRVLTNQKGVLVLGGWAAANIAAGAAGYFLAKEEEWKAFHGMNAAWNVANGLIALGGYAGTRKELSQQQSWQNGLHRFESNKRLYLINAGLDLLYIGSGVFLIEHGKTTDDFPVWNGLGKSVVLQGAFLLFFDSIMYTSHQQRDKTWYRLLSGLSVTGNGLGFRYQLN